MQYIYIIRWFHIFWKKFSSSILEPKIWHCPACLEPRYIPVFLILHAGKEIKIMDRHFSTLIMVSEKYFWYNSMYWWWCGDEPFDSWLWWWCRWWWCCNKIWHWAVWWGWKRRKKFGTDKKKAVAEKYEVKLLKYAPIISHHNFHRNVWVCLMRNRMV